MNPPQFRIDGAEAKRHAASPTIAFALCIESEHPVEAMVLRVQLRIEPQWRAYDGREKTMLNDLFGTPDRWQTTLRTFSWADVPVVVPQFEGSTRSEVCIPCTYDFDQAATRYMHALGEGEVPLRFLFSGAIFRRGGDSFSTERVPWSSESAYRMPLDVWQSAMRACYGDDALIRVHRETLEKLHRYRSLCGALSWDDLFERLIGTPA